MAQYEDMTAPKMTRVTVRVPKTTLEQINAWVDAIGVRRSHLLGIALVAGVRSLMRASALEISVPADGRAEATVPMEEEGTESLAGLLTSIDDLKTEIARMRTEIEDLRERQGQNKQQDAKKRS